MTSAGSPPTARRRTHLTPFTEGLGPWVVLARNAVPVAGVYALGWPVALAVFEIWFDGVTALATMLILQVRTFMRRDPDPAPMPFWLACVAMVALIGIPYWFMLLMIQVRTLGDGFWTGLMHQPDALLALAGVLAANIWRELGRGYDKLPDARIRLEFNWQFSMHLARVGAILIVVFFFFSRPLVVALAVVLSYVEIYPMRTLRFMGGDATLDRENEARSPD